MAASREPATRPRLYTLRMSASLRFFSGLAALVAITAAPGWGQPGTSAPTPQPVDLTDFGGIKAVARASRDSTLSFTFPVEIAHIAVRGGQKVKKGDLLVQGRDDEARYQRDLQRTAAESDLDIRKAEVTRDQAKVEFEAQERLLKDKRAGQEIEYARAKATLAVREVDVEIAKREHAQQQIQLRYRESQVERYALRAPFDGTVDIVLTDVGEVKRETEPVLKIVATDPLWMDVNTPTAQTIVLGLKPGDPAWVVLDLPGDPAVYQGKVIEVAAEANFEANERRVRVELPNPHEWPAGIAAWVRFTPPEGEWTSRVVKGAPERTAASRRPGATPLDPTY